MNRDLEELGLIGHGGMATVDLVKDRVTGERFALKRPKLQADMAYDLNDTEYDFSAYVQQCFENEALVATMAAELGPECFPEIVEIRRDTSGRCEAIVMEFIDGRDIDELVSSGMVTQTRAVEIALHILHALDIQQELGIVHRDIKPVNIMEDGDGHIKVIDFGVASGPMEPTLKKGDIAGSICHMAPEVYWEGNNSDPRSDLYSLGVILYEMLHNGRHPYGEVDMHGSHFRRDMEPMSSDVPRDLQRIVEKLLADIKSRYKTPVDAGIELTRFAALNSIGNLTEKPYSYFASRSAGRAFSERQRLAILSLATGIVGGATFGPEIIRELIGSLYYANPIEVISEIREGVENLLSN